MKSNRIERRKRAEKIGKTLKIRASSCGKLMADSPACNITEKQLATLDKYIEKRQSGKELTSRQKQEFERLIAKRDAPFELSAGAKTYITQLWLELVYDHYKPMEVKQTLKGDLVEDSAIDLLNHLLPTKSIRVTYDAKMENAYLTGHPDIYLPIENEGEDIKAPWDADTFYRAKPDELYHGQCQAYMALTGAHKWRLCYCLINTPKEALWQELKKYWYKLGQDEENKDYQEIANRLEKAHKFDEIFDPEERLKVWTYHKDDEYIDELYFRIREARKYFQQLNLIEEENRYIHHI